MILFITDKIKNWGRGKDFKFFFNIFYYFKNSYKTCIKNQKVLLQLIVLTNFKSIKETYCLI